MDLLAVVHIKSSYDAWKALFDDGQANREEFSDESRTRVAKVDDNTVMVQLFDVDMQKMAETLNNSSVGKAMAEHVEKRDLYKLEVMTPPGA